MSLLATTFKGPQASFPKFGFIAVAILIEFLCTLRCVEHCANADSVNIQSVPQQPAILVLGTAHLNQLESFSESYLSNTLDRLQEYAPDKIGIEMAVGWTVHAMRQQPDLHETTLNSYVRRQVISGQVAQGLLNVSWRQADAQYADPKNECTINPGTIKCVLQAVAAYDPVSGYLRWMYLSGKEKEAFATQARSIADYFERSSTSSNEYYVLAVELARRLGHHRVYCIDDHLEKGPQARLLDWNGTGIKPMLDFWASTKNTEYDKQYETVLTEAIDEKDFSILFRWFDSENYANLDYAEQFAPLDRGDVGTSGSVFRAFWESRNLRMASHITDLAASDSSHSILVIVGAAHAPFFRRYFDELRWMQLNRVNDVLSE